jgi:uncharacterized protein DUF5996
LVNKHLIHRLSESTMTKLKSLSTEELGPTRDHLREVALVLSSLQRAFLPKDPHDWHYGLEVAMRGLVTQPLLIREEVTRASLDLIRYKLRFGDRKWPLHELTAKEIFEAVKVYLEQQGLEIDLEEPEFTDGLRLLDTSVVDRYAEVIWWMSDQLNKLKINLNRGETSEVLLYPHHFDLSLMWLPFLDERQMSLGFSTGDDSIAEPYVYLTLYPLPKELKDLRLPGGAYLNEEGFTGAVLPYRTLVASNSPEELLAEFIQSITDRIDRLLG